MRRGGDGELASPRRSASFACAVAGIAALALAALLAPMPARAFGADGHRIIGELAQAQLSPATARAVADLLAGEADPTLAGIATWADELRETPAGRDTAPLHYVNFPRGGSCRYRARRDCPGGRCVVGAIEDQARRLADRRLPRVERQAALRFLVHFIADVHQPLHAAYADDRGGNLFQVFYIGQGSNLHAVWDSGFLRSPRVAWRRYAARLQARGHEAVGTPFDAGWNRHAPARWAEESCRLLDAAGIYPPRPGRLPADYLDRLRPVFDQQLLRAAARLAGALEALLGPGAARR